MKSRSTPILLAAAVVFIAAGCAPYATYPPIEITGRLSPPEFEPFPTLMARSLHYANDVYGDGAETFAYNLPEGSPDQLYRMMARKVPSGHPVLEPGVPAYHIQTVRTRGLDAEVDLIYPSSPGFHTLVTLTFRNEGFNGWRVTHARPWHLRVEPPDPSYIPPAETAIASRE